MAVWALLCGLVLLLLTVYLVLYLVLPRHKPPVLLDFKLWGSTETQLLQHIRSEWAQSHTSTPPLYAMQHPYTPGQLDALVDYVQHKLASGHRTFLGAMPSSALLACVPLQERYPDAEFISTASTLDAEALQPFTRLALPDAMLRGALTNAISAIMTGQSTAYIVADASDWAQSLAQTVHTHLDLPSSHRLDSLEKLPASAAEPTALFVFLEEGSGYARLASMSNYTVLCGDVAAYRRIDPGSNRVIAFLGVLEDVSGWAYEVLRRTESPLAAELLRAASMLSEARARGITLRQLAIERGVLQGDGAAKQGSVQLVTVPPLSGTALQYDSSPETISSYTTGWETCPNCVTSSTSTTMHCVASNVLAENPGGVYNGHETQAVLYAGYSAVHVQLQARLEGGVVVLELVCGGGAVTLRVHTALTGVSGTRLVHTKQLGMDAPLFQLVAMVWHGSEYVLFHPSANYMALEVFGQLQLSGHVVDIDGTTSSAGRVTVGTQSGA